MAKYSYGNLYNFYVVHDPRGIAPSGYRVPTKADIDALKTFIPPTEIGGRLKSTRTEPDDHPRWDSPNVGATDEYSFVGLPAGRRETSGEFINKGLSLSLMSSEVVSGGAFDGSYIYYGISAVSSSFADTLNGTFLFEDDSAILLSESLEYFKDEDSFFEVDKMISVDPQMGGSIRFVRESLDGWTEREFVFDYNGNAYRTIKIGDQVWTASNFIGTQYNNGDPIPLLSTDATWSNTQTGAYSTYNSKVPEFYETQYHRLWDDYICATTYEESFKTLSFSPLANGWPSFYSFDPDWMIGMNNYLYTFRRGNVYRHNSNVLRNNFYGVQHKSSIKTVINDGTFEPKLFKTIRLFSDDRWAINITPDISAGGHVNSDWLERKEGSWFAYIRNDGSIPIDIDELPKRSINGLGKSISLSGGSPAVTISFPISHKIPSTLSVGDHLYYMIPPYTTPIYTGKITSINVDLVNGINNIVYDPSVQEVPNVPIVQDAMFLYVKNASAESHGLLGHYAVIDLETDKIGDTELFAIEVNVMKSYP